MDHFVCRKCFLLDQYTVMCSYNHTSQNLLCQKTLVTVAEEATESKRGHFAKLK